MRSQAGTSQPKQQLRVCLATALFRPAVGGEERHAEVLGRGLSRAGHRVCVVTQRLPGTPRREVLDGLQIERAIRATARGPLFGLTYAASLGRFLLRHRRAFDIVQVTYLYWDAVVAAVLKPLLAARLVVRVVVAGPGGDVDRFRSMRLWPLIPGADRPTLDRLVTLVVRRGDAFTTHTAGGRKELLALGVAPARCHVVRNGIEIQRFAALPRPPARTGPRRLLCVARLAEQKGLDVLLRALPAVRTAAGPVGLTLLGEGPEEGRLRDLAATLGIADAVQFGGLVTDVLPHLAGADVFVLPSRFEGMPHALLEAMAAGLPIVATAVGANADFLEDSVNGLLVAPDDAAALAAAVARLLGDPPLAARLGAAARQAAVGRYSVESMLEQILAVYWQALTGPVAGGPGEIA